jgi:hypothetical protein
MPCRAREGFVMLDSSDPEMLIEARVKAAQRLAAQPEAYWRFRLQGEAESLGIEPKELEKAIRAIVAEQEAGERKERQAEREEIKRAEARERKSAEKYSLFKRVRSWAPPERSKEVRIWAETHGESPDAIDLEFSTWLGESTLAIERSVAESDPERHPDPVDGAALADEIKTINRRHVVMPEAGAVAAPIWSMLAWMHQEIATHSPILVFSSPDPSAGKSTALSVISFECPRRSYVVVPTVSIYRDMMHGPTLFIDEADELFKNKDLKHIVNAGWTRGATVPRVFGGVMQHIPIFCPKAIGLLGRGGIPPATATRCVTIPMMPPLPSETVEPFPHSDTPELRALRRKLKRWAMDNMRALAAANPTIPSEFGSDWRLKANWRLMFAIAESLGGTWPFNLRAAALQLAPAADQNISWHRRLLLAMEMIFETVDRRDVYSWEVEKWLSQDELSEFRDYNGHRIRAREIAHLLREYGIRPVLLGDRRLSGYKYEQFAEVFARILGKAPEIVSSSHSSGSPASEPPSTDGGAAEILSSSREDSSSERMRGSDTTRGKVDPPPVKKSRRRDQKLDPVDQRFYKRRMNRTKKLKAAGRTDEQILKILKHEALDKDSPVMESPIRTWYVVANHYESGDGVGGLSNRQG